MGNKRRSAAKDFLASTKSAAPVPAAQQSAAQPAPPPPSKRRVVPSLLDAMKDGQELASILDLAAPDGSLNTDLQRAIAEVARVRERPAVAYLGNLLREARESSITQWDNLPFSEMLDATSDSSGRLSIVLATNGGLAHTVIQLVNSLRPRFKDVEFIIPAKCMSAGTLWALSGDRIWIDERGCLGPIDPQVATRDNRMVPLQSLLVTLNDIQTKGQAALDQGKPIPWSLALLLKSMDQKELGEAIAASQFCASLAAQYLSEYKFREWSTRGPEGRPVTDVDRRSRAVEIANKLVRNDLWGVHGHTISRDVAWESLRIRIDRPEDCPGLHRAVRRLWALCHYIFDKSNAAKLLFSEQYLHVQSAKRG